MEHGMSLLASEIAEATGAKIKNLNSGEMRGLVFHDLTTDTRKISADSAPLFVALKGEKFNGEDFASDALEKGASAALVSESFDAGSVSSPIFVVPDTLTAYQKIAQCWRKKFELPLIAITGSNGKTTTKDLTSSVLDARFSGDVLKTEANFNNEIGLPQTLLRLRSHHRAAVVEIGMRGLGQIRALAPIAAPTIGIVTNVGETHMELLGSIENIARAKREMVEAIESGGTVILNGDDARVSAMRSAANENVRVITFGMENDADVMGRIVSTEGERSEFDVSFGGGREERFILPMAGRHNIYNALAALSAGFALGLTADEMRAGLLRSTVTGGRFEIQKIKGYSVINDAYNASPASMMAAFETLHDVARGRTIAVLGDMLELGEISERAHRDVGAAAYNAGIDFLVTRGDMGEMIARGAMDAGMARDRVFMCASHEEAADVLHGILREGDTVLFKGSHGMKMDKIIDLI